RSTNARARMVRDVVRLHEVLLIGARSISRTDDVSGGATATAGAEWALMMHAGIGSPEGGGPGREGVATVPAARRPPDDPAACAREHHPDHHGGRRRPDGTDPVTVNGCTLTTE